jgi:hypothetical protein
MDHFIERAQLVQSSQDNRSLLESEQQVSRVAVLQRAWTQYGEDDRRASRGFARQDTAHGVSSKCSGWPVSGFHRK